MSQIFQRALGTALAQEAEPPSAPDLQYSMRLLLTKSASLTPSEWDEMRARPTDSYETMRSLGDQYARVAEIAYQVYERLDGSGYPRGLRGDEILPEARILGAVDFFESFAHPRPYKTTLPGTANHGIQLLMQMADKFGAPVLKALVGSIGLFPIGSYVRLSSGEIGRVVDVKKENPMRPEVEVLLDNERRPPATPRTLGLLTIQLSQRPWHSRRTKCAAAGIASVACRRDCRSSAGFLQNRSR